MATIFGAVASFGVLGGTMGLALGGADPVVVEAAEGDVSVTLTVDDFSLLTSNAAFGITKGGVSFEGKVKTGTTSGKYGYLMFNNSYIYNTSVPDNTIFPVFHGLIQMEQAQMAEPFTLNLQVRNRVPKLRKMVNQSAKVKQ